MNTIRFFLGSSASLMSLRTNIGDAVRMLSMEMEQRGVRLEMLCWEDYKTEFTGSSKQQEYDEKLVRKSNLVIAVFQKRIGEWTAHELEVAKDANIISYCYCIKHRNRDAVEQELRDKGFITKRAECKTDVIESVMDVLRRYAEDNSLYDTDKSPVASVTHRFYATIPEDMKNLRGSFSNLIRSLDMVTVKELDIHCMLHPYGNINCMDDSSHYIALFKNDASDNDVKEIALAVQLLDDKSKAMIAMSIFQQKVSQAEKDFGIRYDIRSNSEAVRKILDDRQIFTIGMQNLDKVRLQLLLWCLRLRTNSISTSNNGFSCTNGMIAFQGYPVAEIDSVPTFEGIKRLLEEQKSLSEKLYQASNNRDDQALDSIRLQLRSVNAEIKIQLSLALDDMLKNNEQEATEHDSNTVIDCKALLDAQNSELRFLERVQSATLERWKKDEQRLRARRNLLQHAENKTGELLKELKQIQDALLQVVRNRQQAGDVNAEYLIAEQIHTIGIYDTFLLPRIFCNRDLLYAEIVRTADKYGISNPHVEMMRLNLGNYHARQFEYKGALECYETAVDHIKRFETKSRMMRTIISHLYTIIIHSYIEFDYRHHRINELLKEFQVIIESWDIEYDERCLSLADLYAIMLHRGTLVNLDDEDSLIVKSMSLYDYMNEQNLLSPHNEEYGSKMCYLPNSIAGVLLDHYPEEDENATKRYDELIIKYSTEQKKHAEKLLDVDVVEAWGYLGKAYHHIGFLCSKKTKFDDMRLGFSEYKKALEYRRAIYELTKQPSDEAEIAETEVNIGGLALTICMSMKKIPSREAAVIQFAPVEHAVAALNIYEKFKNTGGIGDEMNYYKAVQLYASSIYLLSLYAQYHTDKTTILQMLGQCLSWSRNHVGNPYADVFEGVSGRIFNEEGLV